MTVPATRWPEPVPALVTLHLWRVPGRRVPAALARVALDRRPLHRAPGLRFAKLLGTGRGQTFTPRDADPRRWALLASWADPGAAAGFERCATARRWRRLAEETWRVELRPLASRGWWSGRQPFGPPAADRGGNPGRGDRPAGATLGSGSDAGGGTGSTGGTGSRPGGDDGPGSTGGTGAGGAGDPTVCGAAGGSGLASGGGARWNGPVAAVTRARLAMAPRRAGAFWRAVPGVSADLRGRAGLRLAIGIGEAPVGLQGTFSLWESARALREFAYTGAHAQVVRRTPVECWYAEELFARFAVLSATGTVDGRDPLA